MSERKARRVLCAGWLVAIVCMVMSCAVSPGEQAAILAAERAACPELLQLANAPAGAEAEVCPGAEELLRGVLAAVVRETSPAAVSDPAAPSALRVVPPAARRAPVYHRRRGFVGLVPSHLAPRAQAMLDAR